MKTQDMTKHTIKRIDNTVSVHFDAETYNLVFEDGTNALTVDRYFDLELYLEKKDEPQVSLSISKSDVFCHQYDIEDQKGKRTVFVVGNRTPHSSYKGSLDLYAFDLKKNKYLHEIEHTYVMGEESPILGDNSYYLGNRLFTIGVHDKDLEITEFDRILGEKELKKTAFEYLALNKMMIGVKEIKNEANNRSDVIYFIINPDTLTFYDRAYSVSCKGFITIPEEYKTKSLEEVCGYISDTYLFMDYLKIPHITKPEDLIKYVNGTYGPLTQNKTINDVDPQEAVLRYCHKSFNNSGYRM